MNVETNHRSDDGGPAANAAPILSCRGLHRHLGEGEGRVHVLRGISLDIGAGTVCAVAGPSGCGKSTLLYALGLLDRPDAGEVRIEGENLAAAGDAVRTRTRNESIGFVFQFHFLLPEFSAAENVMLPMYRLGRLAPRDMRRRAGYLLEQVGLGARQDRLATRLSGGEQQRVAVARALANDPSIVLADEPTGNLDAHNARAVVDLLVALARERGRAVVIVTHNEEIAARCDRRVSMLDGRLEADGAPPAL